jgi:site-specific recombinase XerD
MLRRSFASHALKHTDIETVRELGGWSELGVVQRYVVSSGPRKREAVERLVFDEEEIAD